MIDKRLSQYYHCEREDRWIFTEVDEDDELQGTGLELEPPGSHAQLLQTHTHTHTHKQAQSIKNTQGPKSFHKVHKHHRTDT